MRLRRTLLQIADWSVSAFVRIYPLAWYALIDGPAPAVAVKGGFALLPIVDLGPREARLADGGALGVTLACLRALWNHGSMESM